MNSRVNPEIWGQLNAAKKSSDLRQAINMQHAIQKVAFIILQTVDSLLAVMLGKDPDKVDLNKLVSNAVDSFALQGHVTKDLNNFRREQIRPALKPEFASLCSAKIPYGKWLFSEDLPRRICDIKKTNKIGQVVAGSSSKRNFRNDRQIVALWLSWLKRLSGKQEIPARFATTEKYFPKNPSSRKDFFFMERSEKATNLKETTLPTREKILKDLERIKTSVSDLSQFFPMIETYLILQNVRDFRAGRVAQFYENWKNLTCDQQILQNILGAKVDFVETPEQHNLRTTHFNHNEGMMIDAEIEILISKGVIEPRIS